MKKIFVLDTNIRLNDPGSIYSFEDNEVVIPITCIMEIEALTYIRGRSIANQFFIVDEAQNLTLHEIKTIVTRVGHGTKIVLTGDPYQIDNPYLDSESSGLTHLVERFKSSSLSGHITLTRGERSPLAQKAAEIL